jgi:hypothetical protein
MIGDFDDYYPETKDYRMGTASIYRSPKRPKAHPPKYGFKFMHTDYPKRKTAETNKSKKKKRAK